MSKRYSEAVAGAIAAHIIDSGLVTGPDRLAERIASGLRPIILDALESAYQSGAACCKEINSPRRWTAAKERAERAGLRKIARSLGVELTDEECLERFCK